MTRIIHIIGNSGSGKSFIALNLGAALAKNGKSVTLVDANIYSPDIMSYADINPKLFLNEFLDGEKNLEEVATYHPSGMKIIPSMAEDNYDIDKHHKINEALISLIGKSEIVLVDSFSHSSALSSIVENKDEFIFVTHDDYPSITKSRDFIRKLEKRGLNILGVVLNRKRKSVDKKHIEAILERPVLGELPHDEIVAESISNKQLLFLSSPKSKVAKAISDISYMIDI